jgi:hypothetical protein
VTPRAALPLTAAETARQEAILAAEIAAGWMQLPPEDWQLAGPDDLPPDDTDPRPADSPWLTESRPATAPAPRWTESAPPSADGSGQAADGPERPEVLPCGIVAHDTAGPGGPGFASGSVLNELEPGAVLTAALDDAGTTGLAGLGDDELAGVLLAWRRTESHAAAGLLTATAELARRRTAHSDPHVGEHAGHELAILLTLTGLAADALLGQATALTRLPATLAALRTGRIDRSRALVIGYETELLEDATAAAVEQQIIARAPRQTTSQLRARIRDAVLTADPGAVRRRKAKAAQAARVELQPELSGNAALGGRELPPAAALAADARIDACARSLKANGINATLPQLRAAVFLALLTGSDPLGFLPPPDPDPTSPDTGSASDRPDTADTTGRTPGTDDSPAAGRSGPATATGSTPGTSPASDGTAGISANPARTDPARADTGQAGADGTDPDTASAADTGPQDADPDRTKSDRSAPDCAESDGADPGLTGTPRSPGEPPRPSQPGEPGEPNGSGGYSWPGPPGGSCPPGWPGVPGWLETSGTVHLTVPLTTWLGLSDCPSQIPGYGTADPDTSRDLADHIAASRDSRWCLTITDPAGRAIAHACARRPPPASPGDRTGWLRTLTITRIEAGTCSHAREVPGYRIPASLHHIVKTRQKTCSAPYCNRPAARCDDDHSLAHDKGGRTCECNLAPLCRAHHRAKQTDGWHLEQPEPGILTWRLPHGRTYTATPGEYPTG